MINQKIFKAQNYSEGISKFLQNMPELCLDVPLIHSYAWKYVIKPLVLKKSMDLKYLKIDIEDKDKPKVEDDDDILFESSDPLFKVVAHILVF